MDEENNNQAQKQEQNSNQQNTNPRLEKARKIINNPITNTALKPLQSKTGRKIIKNAAPVVGAAVGGPAGAAAGEAVKKALDDPKVDKLVGETANTIADNNKKDNDRKKEEKNRENANTAASDENDEYTIENTRIPKDKVRMRTGILGSLGSLIGKNKKNNNTSANIPKVKEQPMYTEEETTTEEDDTNQSPKKENTNDNKEGTSQEDKSEDKNVLIGGIGKKSISIKAVIHIIKMFGSIGLIFFGLIIVLLIIILIIMVSGSNNIYDYNESGEVDCVNATTCDTVIIPNGPSSGTYSIDEYLAGAINYYFGDYADPIDQRALGIVINTDLLSYSQINSEASTCTLQDDNKYNLLNIPQESSESTNYTNILSAATLSKGEIIIGYAPKIELDLSVLNRGTDYKQTIKNLFKVEKLELEPFGIFPICSIHTTPELSYVDVNGCDMVTVTSGDYMGTYTLDDYVAGVISHEVGGFQDTETFKAFAVAARTYLFTRSSNDNGVCYIGSGSNLQAFRPTTDQQIIDAVSQTTGQVMTDGAGNLVSTEYDAFCYESKDDTNYYLAQKHQAIPISWAYENVPRWSGTSYLENPCGTSGDGGHGRGMSQYGAYYMSTVQNKPYNEILNFYYDNAVLSSSLKNYNLIGDLNSYGLMYPLETTGNCTSMFGNRVHPITGVQKNHNGVDIARPANTPIFAAHDGTVTVNGNDADGYGYYIRLAGDNGIETLYAHMIKPSTLQIGSTITAGTLIGYVGQTGVATGNHLHFEIFVNGSRVDPLTYLPGLCG